MNYFFFAIFFLICKKKISYKFQNNFKFFFLLNLYENTFKENNLINIFDLFSETLSFYLSIHEEFKLNYDYEIIIYSKILIF